jgi:hypothetical protein
MVLFQLLGGGASVCVDEERVCFVVDVLDGNLEAIDTIWPWAM